LCGGRWVRDQAGEDRLIGWWKERIAMSRRDSGRTIWTLLGRRLESRALASRLAALRQTNPALVLSVTKAACGRVSLALGRHREERLNQRQA
jgi:hypothetical protein